MQVQLKTGRDEDVKHEFDMVKSLRHERISIAYEAYNLDNVSVFIMEYLPGEINVLTYLAQKLEYNEQYLSLIVRQVRLFLFLYFTFKK